MKNTKPLITRIEALITRGLLRKHVRLFVSQTIPLLSMRTNLASIGKSLETQ